MITKKVIFIKAGYVWLSKKRKIFYTLLAVHCSNEMPYILNIILRKKKDKKYKEALNKTTDKKESCLCRTQEPKLA